MTTNKNPNHEEQTYRRLLNAATGFQGRFALILIKGQHFDVQRQWQERLAQDIENQNLEMKLVSGIDCPRDLPSITTFLKTQIPNPRQCVINFHHFEHKMIPGFLSPIDTDMLTEKYQPEVKAPSFLQRLNLEREALMEAFPCPFIFWTSASAIRQLANYAPDFFDFRKFVLDLPEPTSLKSLPAIPRTGLFKMSALSTPPSESIEELRLELKELESREPDIEEGHRYIGILCDLSSAEASTDSNQSMMRFEKAFQVAKNLSLPEEMARVSFRIALALAEKKDWKEVETRVQAAINFYRDLSQKHTSLYTMSLIRALNLKALARYYLGENIGAHVILDEALALGRSITNQDTEKPSSFIGEILNNLAVFLCELNSFEKAETAFSEAITIFRSFSHKKYRPSLALVLNNQGNLMAGLRQLPEALLIHEEALQLRRLLCVKKPMIYRIDLSQSLYNLSLLHGEMGDYRHAKALFEEYIETVSHLPLSEIDFLGTHSQAQLNLQIELGDVESSIKAYPSVVDACVVSREDLQKRERLVGYLVVEGSDFALSGLRFYLRSKYPEYLIPPIFMILNELPEKDGSLDKTELPLPDEWAKKQRQANYQPSETPTEKMLLKLIAEFLFMDECEIGVQDQLFELGFDSIAAIELANQIQNSQNITLRSSFFFKFPVIASAAAEIDKILEQHTKQGDSFGEDP